MARCVRRHTGEKGRGQAAGGKAAQGEVRAAARGQGEEQGAGRQHAAAECWQGHEEARRRHKWGDWGDDDRAEAAEQGEGTGASEVKTHAVVGALFVIIVVVVAGLAAEEAVLSMPSASELQGWTVVVDAVSIHCYYYCLFFLLNVFVSEGVFLGYYYRQCCVTDRSCSVSLRHLSRSQSNDLVNRSLWSAPRTV